MKRMMILPALIGLICTSAFAHEEFGLGLIVGEPTGLSVKYWLDEEQAIDGAVAWSFWDGDGLELHADYLWHDYDLLGDEPSSGKLPVYFGVGARLKFREDEGLGHDDNDTLFGIRVPVGIGYLFQGKPFDLFAEISPILDLTPDVELDLSIAVGLRYYMR